jgi:hypothetical protein
MMVAWDRVEGSSAARFNLQSHQLPYPPWQVDPHPLEAPRSSHFTEAAHRKEKKFTHTASAAPARLIIDWEKNLSPPFPLPTVASARLGAFKHRNLGLDTQLRRDASDSSAETAARTALCALIVVDSIECTVEIGS